MRATRRRAKPGEVIVHYGRLPGDGPDIIYSWGGEGASKRHSNVIAYILGSKRIEMALTDEEKAKAGGRGFFFGDTALELLDRSGFDISTLRFSIQVKKAPESNSKDSDLDSKNQNGLQAEACNPLISNENLAEWTGLEPATPGVTGRSAK
jgi:hypothetical protein